MKLLALETSGKNFSLALSEGPLITAQRQIRLKKVLSQSIIPAITSILKKSGMRLKQLDGFVIGLGPGSFTSLRVGLSTVKALALVTGKPVVGIPSLDAIALNMAHCKINQKINQICVLVDAKRNLVYACIYQQDHQNLKKKTDYLLTDIKSLLKDIHQDTLFTGDAVALFKQDILDCEKNGWRHFIADQKWWCPRARALVTLALPKFKQRKFDNIDSVVPMYLYPDDCQVTR